MSGGENNHRQIHRFSMTLLMDNPLHREVWRIISALPVRERTASVSLAVCRTFGERRFTEEDREMLREVIRQELQNVRLAVPAQSSNADSAVNAVNNVNEDVTDYLKSLKCS